MATSLSLTSAALAGAIIIANAYAPSTLAFAEEASVRSTAFEHFRFSFFEDPTSAQDALDLGSLRALQGDERARAEAMLLAYLPDGRVVIGLGVLRSKRALAPLASLMESERRQERQAKLTNQDYWSDGSVDLAKALWSIEPDQQWLAYIIEALAQRPQWTSRMTAAQALFDIYDPQATAALTAALNDDEELVRYHAARGLLASHGLSVDTTDPKHMLYRVMAKDPARRDAAKADIFAAIKGRPLATP